MEGAKATKQSSWKQYLHPMMGVYVLILVAGFFAVETLFHLLWPDDERVRVLPALVFGMVVRRFLIVERVEYYKSCLAIGILGAALYLIRVLMINEPPMVTLTATILVSSLGILIAYSPVIVNRIADRIGRPEWKFWTEDQMTFREK